MPQKHASSLWPVYSKGLPLEPTAEERGKFIPSPFLPRMLTQPWTVYGCQPAAFMISANVASLAGFISAITLALLLARFAFGLLAFFGYRAFFGGLVFLEGARLPFACGASGSSVVAFSVWIVCVLVVFLRDRVCDRDNSSLGETASQFFND